MTTPLPAPAVVVPETSSRTAQPWLNTHLSAQQRAESLLDVMTVDERISLALGDFAAVAHLGIPALLYGDGPNGARDVPGATAFPSAQTLAAAFDTELAEEYGSAVADELRAGGRNVWLGPAVDIARAPLGGRQAEALGEDPCLSGQIAAREVAGARGRHVVSMLKHFIANTHEYLRTGRLLADGRSDALDVIVSERALREIYYPPVQACLAAGLGSVMSSYNRVNGEYVSQSTTILGTLKGDWAFDGCVVPDFLFAVRDPLLAAQAGLDLPGLEAPAGRLREHFTSGQISAERRDDIVRRVLFTMIDGGLFGDCLSGSEPAPELTDHHDLAARIAVAGTVLLTNPQRVLPLGEDVGSIAVIGTAGLDAQFVMGGSACVRPVESRVVTALAGIAGRAPVGTRIGFAQGSTGDVVLPPVRADVLTHDGKPGLRVEYWTSAEPAGPPSRSRTEATLNMVGTAEGMAAPWSATWNGTLTPRQTGVHTLGLSFSGAASLYLDEVLVGSGYREMVGFFGPPTPLTVSADLAAGTGVAIRVEYRSATALAIPPMGFPGPSIELGWAEPDGRHDAAAALAAGSDVAVVIASLAAGEGMDRHSLSLPGDQDALIAHVAAANPRTVVVLNTNGPVLMPWLGDVAAVLQVWHPGEAFGEALGRVLFGDVDPGGRLPVTFPASAADGPLTGPDRFPGVDGRVRYDEGVLVGYRWFDAYRQEPLFPFGHGLSYTDFAYADLALTVDGEVLTASLTVRNVGDRRGSEIVQLYVTDPEGDQPLVQQLKAFAKLSIEPGGTRALELRVPIPDLRTWDETSSAWTDPHGRRLVSVGRSSRDIRLRGSVDLTAGSHRR